MLLVPLDNSNDVPNRVIFCRGCDCGRSAIGAHRDLDSDQKIDIYCRECSNTRYAFIGEHAP